MGDGLLSVGNTVPRTVGLSGQFRCLAPGCLSVGARSPRLARLHKRGTGGKSRRECSNDAYPIAHIHVAILFARRLGRTQSSPWNTLSPHATFRLRALRG